MRAEKGNELRNCNRRHKTHEWKAQKGERKSGIDYYHVFLLKCMDATLSTYLVR